MSDKSKDNKNSRSVGFRRAWEFIKTRWIFVLLTAWTITTVLLVCQRWGHVGELISAISVETLVFVTWFYAMQAKRLVEEEQKKREADLYERRIAEVFMPLNDILDRIRDCFPEGKADTDSVYHFLVDLERLFWAKAYLVSPETTNRFTEVFPYILQDAIDSQRNIPVHNYQAKVMAAKILLNREWRETEDRIRKLYGIEVSKEHGEDEKEKKDSNPAQGETK